MGGEKHVPPAPVPFLPASFDLMFVSQNHTLPSGEAPYLPRHSHFIREVFDLDLESEDHRVACV